MISRPIAGVGAAPGSLQVGDICWMSGISSCDRPTHGQKPSIAECFLLPLVAIRQLVSPWTIKLNAAEGASHAEPSNEKHIHSPGATPDVQSGRVGLHDSDRLFRSDFTRAIHLCGCLRFHCLGLPERVRAD